MLSMKFSSRLAALARLFFTLGAFRLWQLTDLWHININYAVQPRACAAKGGARVALVAGVVDAVAAFTCWLLQMMTTLLKAH